MGNISSVPLGMDDCKLLSAYHFLGTVLSLLHLFQIHYTLLFNIDSISHLTYKKTESYSERLNCLNSYNRKMVEPGFKEKSYLNIKLIFSTSPIREKKVKPIK